ncbi:MAG: dephospho-CoA kinase [Candidatus Omnitrophica bacterium]|nr:dephospho-CoA kinase [Candidatus Omnitrophota bacterium]
MGSRNIKKQRKLIKIGITGIFGSGKTTVSSMFKKSGISVISCDAIVHHLLKKEKIINKIKNIFGEDVIRKGKVERKTLSNMVFSDRCARRKLEGILHPEVFKEINKKLLDYRDKKSIIAIEIPLLFETKSEKLVDKIVVVSSTRQKILQRLEGKFKREDIIKRWKSQIPLKEKEQKADYVINNSGSYSETFRQVQTLIKRLETLIG